MSPLPRFLVVLLFAFPLFAQQGQVPYIETLDVRVHSVDVVVTDAKGNPVGGLTQGDFELLEDGVAKPITNFSSFVATPAAASAPAAEATAQRPPRKFIFSIDEISLVSGTRKKLLRELDGLLTTAMQPGDEAMVLRPAAETKARLATFTGDREQVRKKLRDAIESEKWRTTAPIARELQMLEAEMRGPMGTRERRLAARRWSGKVRSRVIQRLGQLGAIVNAAAAVEGRKVLIVVSESLPMEPGREAFTAYSDRQSSLAGDPDSFGDWTVSDQFAADWANLAPQVNEIARNAATNGITIYAVQAEYGIGLLAPGGDIGASSRSAASDVPSASASPRAVTPSATTLVSEMISNTQSALGVLAGITGGTAHVGAGTIDDMAGGIARDVESYYSLGYRASEQVDRAHALAVRVKGRSELRVRARTQVIRKSPEREMNDRVVAALLDPVKDSEIPIQVESKVVGAAPDRSYQTFWIAVHVPLDRLTFIPDRDVYRAKFSVHYAAMGEDVDFVSGMAGSQVVEVPADKFASAQGQRYTYVVPMNLRPSSYTLVLGVLDSIAHTSGFGTAQLTVR